MANKSSNALSTKNEFKKVKHGKTFSIVHKQKPNLKPQKQSRTNILYIIYYIYLYVYKHINSRTVQISMVHNGDPATAARPLP